MGIFGGKYCLKCNPVNPPILGDYGEFCTFCGSKLEAEMPKVPKCNWCRAKLYSSHRYCGGCGRDRKNALETRPSKKNWFSLIRLFKMH